MPTSDSHPEPLSGQLADLGAVIAVDDSATSLAAVRGTVASRRRRRNLIGGGVAAAVLVAGGVVVIGAVSDGGGSDTIAIEGASDGDADGGDLSVGPAAQGDGEPSADSDSEADSSVPPAVAVETRQVAAISPAATRVSLGAGQGEVDEYVDWVVPWQGGFLAARSSFTPQPVPAELPDDVVALFPPEVVEFFDGDLPPTVDEAMGMLSEAGLLDDVMEVLESSPEAAEAIYGIPKPGAPDVTVMYSADGVDWEPIDFVVPDGAMGLYGMQSTGTRLAVVFQQQPEFLAESAAGTSPLDVFGPNQDAPTFVATTTDLTNWDLVEVEVPARPADLPDLFFYGSSPGELAINDTGWVLGLHTYADIDIEALLPDDVREAVQLGGYGMDWNDDGLRIELHTQGFPATTVLADADGSVEYVEPEVTETLTFTWDELDIDPSVVETINDDSHNSQMFTASWGSPPIEVDGVEAWNVAAGHDGFYVAQDESIAYSADGVTWTQIPLPENSVFVSSIAPLLEGVLVLIDDGMGNSSPYRLANASAVWERLEIPSAPASMSDVFGGMNATSAMIVDGTDRGEYEPFEFTVEADGFTMVMTEGVAGSSVFVTDSAGAVVAEGSFDWRDGGEPTLWRASLDGMEILSEGGEPIVTFGNDVMEAAYREQAGPITEFEPDLWLVATVDGERWLVEDLDTSIDDGMFGPSGVAISGDVLLVSSGTGWDRYDLS